MFRKPNVHLWIFNHPFYGISDQVEYFKSSMMKNNYNISVGRKPKGDALNVVIENFSLYSRKTLLEFCESTGKRVSVIMTEHLDFKQDEIFIHGDPLWSGNDYMHPATQVERLKSLFDCLPHVKSFLVLGDLPALEGISQMLPGVDVRAIPFPEIDFVRNEDAPSNGPADDLLFTGVQTRYRADLLPVLSATGLSVQCPQKFVSRKRRDELNRSAKLVLNIPQREGWKWLSLMRIIAALRCGRATVSLGTKDNSKIAECTYQLDVKAPDWQETLKSYVADWTSHYELAHENYCRMRKAFEAEHSFPHDLIECWAITERL